MATSAFSLEEGLETKESGTVDRAPSNTRNFKE